MLKTNHEVWRPRRCRVAHRVLAGLSTARAAAAGPTRAGPKSPDSHSQPSPGSSRQHARLLPG
jgi:hypothetical protein